ncbi:MAG TPA: hypothetical protein VLA93_13870 [Pyrinomonadaceae bacterium]|nr:hypothetical protein [Pyrinomonadaceae bacterium]
MRGSVRTVSIDAFDTLLFFTGGLIFAVFVFRRELLGREPLDTYFVWTPGLAADRFFNILFSILAVLVWIFTPLFINRF